MKKLILLFLGITTLLHSTNVINVIEIINRFKFFIQQILMFHH